MFTHLFRRRRNAFNRGKIMVVMLLLLLMIFVTASCEGDSTAHSRSTTQIGKQSEFHISFDETNTRCITDRRFVSFTFSAGGLNKTDNGYDIASHKLRVILRALSPAVVRIGGSKANFLYFKPRHETKKLSRPSLGGYPNDQRPRLESRAYVPLPSEEDITRLEAHKYKRHTPKESKEPKESNETIWPMESKGAEDTEGSGESGESEEIKWINEPTEAVKRGVLRNLEEPKESKLHEVSKGTKGHTEHQVARGPKEPKGTKENEGPFKPKEPVKHVEKPEDHKEAEELKRPKPPKELLALIEPEVSKKPFRPKTPKKHKDLTPEEMTAIEKKKLRPSTKEKEDGIKGFKTFEMHADVFDMLYNLINSTGNTMLFDLNAFPRMSGSRKWDHTNADILINYVTEKKYHVDWQLGNEPNHYQKFGKDNVQSGEEVGSDYVLLRNLVQGSQPNAKIIGPDTTRPKNGGKVQQWLGSFLKIAADTIDAVAWHQYYIDGRKAKPGDFIDPDILDQFKEQNKNMKEILIKNNFTKPVWITETGSAWGGGAKDLSDRFAGIFPFVDKLGVAGDSCVSVVARQSFLDGKYAMVNKTGYNPHPDFYVAALFKRLAATAVLGIQMNKQDSRFRVYARCAKATKHTLPGSVFVIVINLNKESKSFSFPTYELFKTKQYLFTANSLNSDVINLNGKPLTMVDDKLPRMVPVFVDQPIIVPGHSVGFYILDLISLAIC